VGNILELWDATTRRGAGAALLLPDPRRALRPAVSVTGRLGRYLGVFWGNIAIVRDKTVN